MKTKSNSKPSVNVVTLGCSKNWVDSEEIVTQLKGNEIDVHHESSLDHHQVIIINTCGFIDQAKQESIDTILQYAQSKQKGSIEKLYVTGCLSQRYREELKTEIPEVDAWFGTRELPLLLKKFKADYKHELVGERILSHSSHYAYLKISEGCDRPCSFCAIPIMRGKHVSKPIELIVKEAQNLVNKGVKELLLIAQDSTYYGLDINGKRQLAQLLDRLSDVEGLEWIRLHYAFPTGFPTDVLKIMADKPNICKYLDIPLQHGSTEMLKIMRRGTSREKTEELIELIRNTVPDIALRTTMIVGHPGEREREFEEMVHFVEKMKFERMGVFTYSHEEQTHAYSMNDDVPENIKSERADILMTIQEKISLSHNEQKIGSKVKTLIDREEGGYFIGRTEHDSPEVDNEVLISNQYPLIVGEFYSVEISDVEPFDLFGVPNTV